MKKSSDYSSVQDMIDELSYLMDTESYKQFIQEHERLNKLNGVDDQWTK